MTPLSVLHVVEALLWVALIFVALAGYGTAALRLCRVRRPLLPLAAVAGLAVVIFAGGWLNLLHAITPLVCRLLVAVGVVGFAVARPKLLPNALDEAAPKVEGRSPWLRPMMLLVSVTLLFRLACGVHSAYYQSGDDYNFYLAAPVKMLSVHEYAADPYSERRVMSSLGGNYFLQTVVLSELPLEDVQLADRGLGLLLLAAVTIGLGAAFGLSSLQTAALGFFLLLTPQLQFNLTFVMLPYALFCGAVYLAADTRELGLRPTLQGLLIGATAGVVTTLKSVYLPHGLLFLGLIALLYARRRGLPAGVRTLAWGLLALVAVLLPWMIASHYASATWFYPILGKGYQYSAYGLFPAPSTGNMGHIVAKVMIFNLPVLGVLLVEWFFCAPDERTRVLAAFTAAALGASILAGIATGGDSVRRYNYPMLLPAVLLLFVAASRRVNLRPSRGASLLALGSAALCVCLAFYVGLNSWTHEYRRAFLSLRAGFTDSHIVPAETKLRYAALERAMPVGSGGVIATVDDPFLFDFHARDIAIADIPGAASVPPGWPSRAGGEALAAYLLSHDKRYLALSVFDPKKQDEREDNNINNPAMTEWIRSESKIRRDSYHQYYELAQTRKHLYDDGHLVLLDLAARVAPH